MPELTQDRLKELLHYDPDTGVFKWIGKTFHTMKMRDVAGNKSTLGYIVIRINGKAHKAHRLAWLYIHGKWPDRHIDHINRNKTDNRIKNLRLASGSENCRNRMLLARNKSGCTGVFWNKRFGLWCAKIQICGKIITLGSFLNKEDAIQARKKAEIMMAYDPSLSGTTLQFRKALWHLANEFAKLKGHSVAA